MYNSGIVVKLMKEHRQERHIPACLRHAGKDSEGFYLKIDCEAWVQVYVCLSDFDAERVVNEWGAILTESPPTGGR